MPSNFRAMSRSFHSVHADILDNRHFLMTLIAALMLHIMAFTVYHFMPHEEVMDIPVRALNIKLGDGDELSAEEIKAIQPQAPNKNDVENTISRVVQDDTNANEDRTQSLASKMDKAIANVPKTPASPGRAKVVGRFDVRSEGTAAAAPVMSVTARQFVRDLAPVSPTGQLAFNNASQGTVNQPGNSSAKDAEMISRYEQLISLWIQKYKVYPDEARAQNMQGATMVRIRIDRRGNVHYYELERSTGFTLLDRAAIDMIRRANPVPAVPPDYPQGEMLEFLIPVNFELK